MKTTPYYALLLPLHTYILICRYIFAITPSVQIMTAQPNHSKIYMTIDAINQ